MNDDLVPLSVDWTPEPLTMSAPTARRRRGLRAAAVLTACVAVIASGAAIVVGLSGVDGATTPAGAVQDLLAAASAGDIPGIVAALPPSERSAFPVDDVASELTRLGILAPGTDLHALPGVSLRFDGVTTTTADLADGVAVVTFTGGTLHESIDPQKLPAGPTVLEAVGGASKLPPPHDRTEPLTNPGSDQLVTIREGGGWHVSLWYTDAEQARKRSRASVPVFGGGVPAVGAPTAEDAVRTLFSAASGFDTRRLVELTAPVEARALHDYAPLLLAKSEAAALAIAAAGVKIDVTNLALASEAAGDRATVTVTAATLLVHTRQGTSKVTWDGKCLVVTRPDASSSSSCTHRQGSGGAPGLAGVLFDAAPLAHLRLTAVHEEGAWFIDPAGSVSTSLVGVLHGLSQADLSRAIKARISMSTSTGESMSASSDPIGTMITSVPSSTP